MKIAIVGTGISGLGAAYRSRPRTRRERLRARRPRRAATRTRSRHDGLALDTGFLVHNDAQLPAARRACSRELGVRDAGVGDVVLGRLRPAAGSSTPAGGRSRRDGTRRARASRRCSGRSAAGCGRRAGRSTRPTTSSTRSQAYVDEHGYSHRFRRHFLVPLTSALWSTAPGRALDFPAAYAIRFFDNHGMLGLRRYRWRTVSGGADTYVRALSERLGPQLRLGVGARSLRRDPAASS